jgi:hypothetical protein
LNSEDDPRAIEHANLILTMRLGDNIICCWTSNAFGRTDAMAEVLDFTSLSIMAKIPTFLSTPCGWLEDVAIPLGRAEYKSEST